jgi:hypothetical protein
MIRQARIIEDDHLHGMPVAPEMLVVYLDRFGNIAQAVRRDNKDAGGRIHWFKP